MFAGLMVLMYFFMIRPQKKQEKKDAAMRDALAVGDEVTTIGGIIGKVVSIKEETFVLETTKDRTKIRFLKGAIRSVDVKIADVAAAQAAEKAEKEAEKTEATETTEEK
ncbi:MAG: preprotein translocase subunit YajC [Clostridia bacterium]|nr:preprotein translocase subunit YajC [Clostridia bacterium]